MFFYKLLLIIFVQNSFSFVLQQKAVCKIDPIQLDPQPIIVNSTTLEFIYPELEQSIILNFGETILISCPGGTFSTTLKTYTTTNATCVSGNQFQIVDEIINFESIFCSRMPFHTARYTNKSCESNGKEIEVGFILTDDLFTRQIIICFDTTTQLSYYSYFNLTKSIGYHQSGVARPSFVQDTFYNVGSVNNLYVRNNQKSTINGLLGLPPDSTQYIAELGNYYLARGHLTAKADFVYGTQQRATFHYVNAAPQWQTVNGYNWEVVESDVRNYAESERINLIVYTGVYGVTTLPHAETGEEIELYLFVDGDERALPVPELFWKIVYHSESKRGVVLITINNPYQLDVSKSVICEDVSERIKWLTWIKNDVQLGFGYACDVNDFSKIVQYIPDLYVETLLL